MLLIDWYAIVVLVLLALRVGYTDIRYGKIGNTTLLWGVGAMLGAWMLYGGMAWMEGTTLDSGYAVVFAWNLFMGVLVGYGLWHWNVWSAGDGKLFMVLVGLVPLHWYAGSYIGFFPGIVLLINGLLPLVGFIVLRIGWLLWKNGEWRRYMQGFRSFHPWQWGAMFLQFVGLFFVGRLVFQSVATPLREAMMEWLPVVGGMIPAFHDRNAPLVLAFLLVVGLRGWVSRYSYGVWILTGGAMLVTGVQLMLGTVTGTELWSMLTGGLLWFFLALLVLRAVTMSVLNHVRVDGVAVEDLRPGMVLTPHGYRTLCQWDEQLFGAMNVRADGLSMEDVGVIRSWNAHRETGHPVESVECYVTTAFGPFLLVGVVLTWFFGGLFW